MRSINVICLTIIALAMTACVTAEQRQAATVKKIEQDAGSELKTCRMKVYNNIAYASVTQHYPSQQSLSQPSAVQLSDNTFPSREDSQLMVRMHNELIPCRQVFLSKTQAIPAMTQIYISEWRENDDITVQLVKQKITWGQAVGQRQRVMAETSKKLLAASHHVGPAPDASELAKAQTAALAPW